MIVWITLINFFYLMTQMVVAIEDVSVRTGVRLALKFVWGHLREVAAVFGVVLLMVDHRDRRVDPGDRRPRPDRVRPARGSCRAAVAGRGVARCAESCSSTSRSTALGAYLTHYR